MRTRTIIPVILTIVMIMLLFCACGKTEPPEQPEPVEEAAVETIEEPTVETVQIGPDSFVEKETESLEIFPGNYTSEYLLENIGAFDRLRSITIKDLSFSEGELSPEEICEIRNEYPDMELRYSFEYRGTDCSEKTAELDFTTLTEDEVEEAAGILSILPEVTEVLITPDDGDNLLSIASVGILESAAPQASFDFRFELFGKLISTRDELIKYADVRLNNEGAAELSEILNYLPACKRVEINDCGIDNETMAEMRDAHPDKAVVWRVNVGGHSFWTDQRRLRFNPIVLSGKPLDDLKYCTSAEFIDMGHNMGITDVSFAEYMPNLKGIILSEARLTSVEGLGSCKNLQFIELVDNKRLFDISPLAGCTSLRLLNLSGSPNITDLSPLYGLDSLERLYFAQNKLSDEEKTRTIENLPNCWVTVEPMNPPGGVSVNYGVGWRLDSMDSSERTEWYLELREIFDYHQDYCDLYYYFNSKYTPVYPELHYFH